MKLDTLRKRLRHHWLSKFGNRTNCNGTKNQDAMARLTQLTTNTEENEHVNVSL